MPLWHYAFSGTLDCAQKCRILKWMIESPVGLVLGHGALNLKGRQGLGN